MDFVQSLYVLIALTFFIPGKTIMNGKKVSSLHILLAMIIVFSAGCSMVGPDFHPPAAPVAEHWEETDEESIRSEAAEYNEWWKVFNDPILDKLINTAYGQNLSLRIAGLRVLQARAQLGVAEGDLYPQVQELNAGYGYQKLSHPLPWESRYFSDLSVGFDASWEVDFWGKFRRGIQSANDKLYADIANYDDILVTLTAEVARKYVRIRTLEERILLAEENVNIQKKGVDLTITRYEGGVVTELDVQQAKTILWTTRALIPRLQVSLRKAENSLSILLGIPPEDLEDYLTDSGPIPAAPASAAVGIPADLLRRRPDIRQAEFQASAQCSRIGIARSELYPSFIISGNIGWDATNANDSELGDLFDDENLGFTVGPAVRWKFLNYGRLDNRIRVQDAIFEQYLTHYNNVVLNAAREVEDSLTGFKRTRIESNCLKESVQAAKRSSEISLLQYQEGTISYQPVLDALSSLSRLQDQYAQTQGEIVINLVSLYKALGGGWQLSQGKNFIPDQVKKNMEQRTGWGDLLDLSND